MKKLNEKDDTSCPCNSGNDFYECCWPFVMGSELPKTAEQLMRSRYTAFTKANTDYIVSTMKTPKGSSGEMRKELAWVTQVKWMGLKVHHTEKGGADDATGMVEFTARFKEPSGKAHRIGEISLFEKIDGRWVYTGQQEDQASSKGC